MKLTVPEFLQIRERRSQDDIKALIAHVEAHLGVDPPAPEPSHSDVPPFDAPPEPQQVVEVTTTPPPAPVKPAVSNKRARQRRSSGLTPR